MCTSKSNFIVEHIGMLNWSQTAYELLAAGHLARMQPVPAPCFYDPYTSKQMNAIGLTCMLG